MQKPLFEDTSPEAEAVLIEGMRRMTAAQKLAQVQALTLRARYALEQDVRRAHPEADEWEIKLRWAARWHGPDFTRKHFGWDPDVEGY
jgi:hypothetical protein